MNSFIDAVILSLLEVRECIGSNDSTLFDLYTQGDGGDISSGFDLVAESVLFKHLNSYGSFYSEESGWMSPQSNVNIITDPIDGSDNFSSFFPYYGISIAREMSGETTEGIVCNLVNGDVFIRTSDEYYKTYLDNPTLKVAVLPSQNPKIGLFEKSYEHPDLIKILIGNKFKFRSPGALALSLAYAPLVKYVLFLGTMRKFDIQAGLFLSRHLYSFSDERYILLSPDKEVFKRIRLIVEKEYF
ncbi:MAG: inositol monophosphatase [Sulfuricurvum sp.]|nr:inositol monophosphatase [Sulfuricurvum sp.]MDD5387187.1 inositol monophosphatase [Sulfuricurvum sp.]